MKECPCGIAAVDCEYHKPAKPKMRVYEYDEVELFINDVKLALDDAAFKYYSCGYNKDD